MLNCKYAFEENLDMNAPQNIEAAELEQSRFENLHKVVSLFIDNAKTYTQLSSAALVISIAFLREVTGVEKDKPMPLDGFLIGSWICFPAGSRSWRILPISCCEVFGGKGRFK